MRQQHNQEDLVESNARTNLTSESSNSSSATEHMLVSKIVLDRLALTDIRGYTTFKFQGDLAFDTGWSALETSFVVFLVA